MSGKAYEIKYWIENPYMYLVYYSGCRWSKKAQKDANATDNFAWQYGMCNNSFPMSSKT